MSEEKWYPAEGEPNVMGRFAYYDILDIPASKAADETITKKIVVIWTMVRGAGGPNPPQKVTPDTQPAFVKRFPSAWKAFQGEEIPVVGTPIAEMPGFDSARVSRFRLAGVHTIENLAALSDIQCQQIEFGTRKIRDEAIKMLAARSATATAQMVAEHQNKAPVDIPAAFTPKRKGRPPGAKNKAA